MKKNFFLLACAALFLLNCGKTKEDPYSYEQSTIYSESNKTNFNAILLDLKPYILDGGVKKYLVATQLTNVTLKVDDDAFGDKNSLIMDTAIIAKQVLNNYLVTTEDITYGVYIPFKSASEPITTAGQYSDLLNNMVILSPGYYHCRIASFEVKMANGAVKKVSTNITQYFEIRTGMKNHYLGSFEVLVK